jgi:hypothetical protein
MYVVYFIVGQQGKTQSIEHKGAHGVLEAAQAVAGQSGRPGATVRKTDR